MGFFLEVKLDALGLRVFLEKREKQKEKEGHGGAGDSLFFGKSSDLGICH